jgi:hypothetical protein
MRRLWWLLVAVGIMTEEGRGNHVSSMQSLVAKDRMYRVLTPQLTSIPTFVHQTFVRYDALASLQTDIPGVKTYHHSGVLFEQQ